MKGKWGAPLGPAAPASFLPPPPPVFSRERETGREQAGSGSGCPTPRPPHHVIMCLPFSLLQLHYQHQVVQNLHRLWRQCTILPPKAKEARPGEEERLSPRAQAATAPPAHCEEASMKVESSVHLKSPALDSQPPWQDSEALRDTRDPLGSQKTRPGAKGSQRKSLMEEIPVEGRPDLESARRPWELGSLPPAQWNLCLESFRKVLPQPWGVGEKGPGTAGFWCSWPEPGEGSGSPSHPHGQRNNLLRAWRKQLLGHLLRPRGIGHCNVGGAPSLTLAKGSWLQIREGGPRLPGRPPADSPWLHRLPATCPHGTSPVT